MLAVTFQVCNPERSWIYCRESLSVHTTANDGVEGQAQASLHYRRSPVFPSGVPSGSPWRFCYVRTIKQSRLSRTLYDSQYQTPTGIFPPFPTLVFEENLNKIMLSSSRLLALIRPSTWRLEPEATFASNSAWSNQDMDPVPPHLQTWTTLNYTTFWISCFVNVTVWELASSMIAVGLSWYDLHRAHRLEPHFPIWLTNV